jgi:hypothetical protein
MMGRLVLMIVLDGVRGLTSVLCSGGLHVGFHVCREKIIGLMRMKGMTVGVSCGCCLLLRTYFTNTTYRKSRNTIKHEDYCSDDLPQDFLDSDICTV